MKKTLLTPLLLCAALGASAQLNKSNLMVGGDIGTTGFTFQKGATAFDFSINPRVGTFVSDHFVFGAGLDLGIDARKGSFTANYGLVPFVRYFLTKEDVKQIPRRAAPFLEAGFGFGGQNTTYETGTSGGKETVTTNGPLFNFSPGLDIFLTRNVAAELALQYKYIGGDPDYSRLGINLGFQIFLTRADARRSYKETKADVKTIN